MTEFLQDRSLSRIPRRVLADQPKLRKVVALMKDVDIPTESLSDLANGWKVAKEKLLGDKFQKGFKQAAEQTIIGTIGVLGGGAGKVFAIGMELGDIARTLLGKDEHFGKVAPTRGEWVAINNGVSHIKKQVKGLYKSATEGSKLPEVAQGKIISIGFVVEPGQETNSVVVFNFQTKQKEERLVRETLVLPADKQARLDLHPVLMKLKNIVLEDDSYKATLGKGVPVDPGSEVVYNGKLYTVLSCDGFSASIQGGNSILTVDVNYLSRGRVKHTQSNNYSRNTESWTTGKAPDLYSGQWVWLKPRSSTHKKYRDAGYELGVLRLVNGAIADGYYALDGIRFRTHVTTIKACPQSDQEWMNTHPDFRFFKEAATKGVGVGRLKLGRDHLTEVIGRRTAGEGKLPKKLKTATKDPLVTILEAGERNRRERPETNRDEVDAAKEIQEKFKITNQNAKNIVDGRVRTGVHEMESNESRGGPGNASLAFVGVLIAAAVFFVTR